MFEHTWNFEYKGYKLTMFCVVGWSGHMLINIRVQGWQVSCSKWLFLSSISSDGWTNGEMEAKRMGKDFEGYHTKSGYTISLVCLKIGCLAPSIVDFGDAPNFQAHPYIHGGSSTARPQIGSFLAPKTRVSTPRTNAQSRKCSRLRQVSSNRAKDVSTM